MASTDYFIQVTAGQSPHKVVSSRFHRSPQSSLISIEGYVVHFQLVSCVGDVGGYEFCEASSVFRE